MCSRERDDLPMTHEPKQPLTSPGPTATAGEPSHWSIPELVAQFWKDESNIAPTEDEMETLMRFAAWMFKHEMMPVERAAAAGGTAGEPREHVHVSNDGARCVGCGLPVTAWFPAAAGAAPASAAVREAAAAVIREWRGYRLSADLGPTVEALAAALAAEGETPQQEKA
jgi:hypothetical protein